MRWVKPSMATRVAVVDVLGDRLAQRGDHRGCSAPPQKSTGYTRALPVRISSGSSGEAFSQTSSIERLGL